MAGVVGLAATLRGNGTDFDLKELLMGPVADRLYKDTASNGMVSKKCCGQVEGLVAVRLAEQRSFPQALRRRQEQ